jgi:hypothetical protein
MASLAKALADSKGHSGFAKIGFVDSKGHSWFVGQFFFVQSKPPAEF